MPKVPVVLSLKDFAKTWHNVLTENVFIFYIKKTKIHKVWKNWNGKKINIYL